jgi:RNA polymerase sigma-70 factor (ECF subfamily)
MNERTLIAAAQAGDRQAFNELVLCYQGIAYNVAYRILGCAEAAADATQEAFLSAYRAVEHFRGKRIKSWLLRIVTNTCYDQLRTRRRRSEISLDAETDLEWGEWSVAPLESPRAFAERQELSRSIQRALNTLPREQRAVIVLADIQDMSYREVSATLRIPLGTVRSRLHRARLKMRQALSHMDAAPARYHCPSRAAHPTQLDLDPIQEQCP